MEKQINFIEWIKKNLKWFILLLCMIIFIEILENVLQDEIHNFDSYIYSKVSKFINEPNTSILRIITNIGGRIVITFVTLGSFIFIKEKKYGIYITINVITITLINQILKFAIRRPRPEGFRLIEETGYSFPSGHSMVSLAFYGFIIYLIYNNVKNQYIRAGMCTILSILILIIGISRIYLGVHYASDVIGGFCFSIGYLIIFTKIVGKDIKSISKKEN